MHPDGCSVGGGQHDASRDDARSKQRRFTVGFDAANCDLILDARSANGRTYITGAVDDTENESPGANTIGHSDTDTAADSARDYRSALAHAGARQPMRRSGKSVELQLLRRHNDRRSARHFLQLLQLHREFLERRRVRNPVSGPHVQQEWGTVGILLAAWR